MRWSVVLIEFKESEMIVDPDIVATQLVSEAVKNINIEAMTEEQFYSALKNELLKKQGVHRVVIVRGIYAPSEESACKSAHEIFELAYKGDLPRGCVVIPSFYQIIDPVAEESNDLIVFALLALMGGVTLAMATILAGKGKKVA